MVLSPLPSTSNPTCKVMSLLLGAKESMNAIAHHRALSHKETTLAQYLFNLSGGLPADVHPGNKIAAQQIGQNAGIDLVGFDLRSEMMRVLNGLANTMSSRGMAPSRISNSQCRFKQASKTTRRPGHRRTNDTNCFGQR